MTDRPHPDLDAPLSAAEADEMRRVTDFDPWYVRPTTRRITDGLTVAHAEVRIRHADGSSTFVCETFPDLAEQIVQSVNASAALVAEVRRLRSTLEEAADRLTGVHWYLRSIHAGDIAKFTSGVMQSIDAALASGPSSGEAR